MNIRDQIVYSILNEATLQNGIFITEILYKTTVKDCTMKWQGGGFLDTHEKLNKLLTERGWTEYRLAKEAKLSESTIMNIFRRNATPSIPTLDAICKGFGITVSQFFAENEMVELSPELKEMFDGWVFLTPVQKAAVLNIIRAFNENPK